MNRRDLQLLAKTRLREAKVLLRLGHHSGAYYLAGYSVECALKAVIAKGVARYEFPEKKRVDDSYKHDLQLLVRVARIENSRVELRDRDPAFSDNWDLVADWSEQSRYKLWERAEAEALVRAITQKQHGVMVWLIQHW
jgi:HEPN domain-containing protein